MDNSSCIGQYQRLGPNEGVIVRTAITLVFKHCSESNTLKRSSAVEMMEDSKDEKGKCKGLQEQDQYDTFMEMNTHILPSS